MDFFERASLETGEGLSNCVMSYNVLREGDNLRAIKVTARLLPEEPLIKRQNSFPAQNAVLICLPAPNFTEALAVYQHKEWWHRPAFVKTTAEIPKRTQLLLWREDGGYRVLLAFCGARYRSDISGTEHGIEISLSSNLERMRSCEEAAAVYAFGDDPYALCRQAAAYALKVTGRAVRLREDKTYPPVFEKLGWCTWDAFYKDVDEDGIRAKLEEIKAKDIPVGWVLIDDGWSQYDNDEQQLTGLDADGGKFPGGLASAAKAIRASGIPHAGVWQAAMGYWNGVAEGSPAHAAQRENLRRLPDGRHMPNPDRSFQFWNLWHERLARQGVSFVKIDGQSATGIFCEGLESYGEASRKMTDGIRASAAINFNGQLINCMGTASQELWNGSGAALIRASDDFVPDAPGGFAEHCKQNAYFSLIGGQLYWCDWDMFWSGRAEATRHAILRAVSGGPVYTSDKVGETNASVLKPLTLDDGTLLRCEGVGMPSRECLLSDPVTSGKPFTVFNTWGTAELVAAFNLWEKNLPVTGRVTPPDKNTPYIVYDRQKENAELVGDGYRYELPPGSASVYLLLPAEEGVTLIGLVDKYLAAAGVTRRAREAGGVTVWLRQGGRFGFFANRAPARVVVNGADAKAARMGGGLYTVECPPSREAVTVKLLYEGD